MGVLCNNCERCVEGEFKNECDILNKIQQIADSYALKLNIQVYECNAYKEDS